MEHPCLVKVNEFFQIEHDMAKVSPHLRVGHQGIVCIDAQFFRLLLQEQAALLEFLFRRFTSEGGPVYQRNFLDQGAVGGGQFFTPFLGSNGPCRHAGLASGCSFPTAI